MNQSRIKISKLIFSVLLASLLLLYFVGTDQVGAAEKATQAQQAGHEIIWIDVRSWAEHQFDSIEGDPRIHFSEIVERVSETYPGKNTEIRLYCASGGRAQTALNSLKSAGYMNISNVGGIDRARKLRELSNG